MDCSYLPRTLIFEPIELVSTETEFSYALYMWAYKKWSTSDQIFSTTVKQVGCASGYCEVRTISSTFIGRPDSRMLYRVPICMCACMTVRLQFPRSTRNKLTWIFFSRSQVKRPSGRPKVHMHTSPYTSFKRTYFFCHTFSQLRIFPCITLESI